MPLKGGIGNWIKDFKKSDAPQFKGKSDEKKRDMAIAAYLDAKNEERSVSEATAKVDYFIGHKHAELAGIGVKVHRPNMMGGDDVTLSHPDKKKLQKYVDNHAGGAEQGVHVKESIRPTRLKTYLNESTNWKGGSKHIGLARYSAKQGYGVQITQIKAMPGDKMNWAKGAGFVKMPVKDIPKLIKALQNVYKAPANVQLGDDD